MQKHSTIAVLDDRGYLAFSVGGHWYDCRLSHSHRSQYISIEVDSNVVFFLNCESSSVLIDQCPQAWVSSLKNSDLRINNAGFNKQLKQKISS